ncbi:unnamed protein product [Auanema sp. JU1783]|nr:unnamed protein product [Auanema sp. JU1783]
MHRSIAFTMTLPVSMEDTELFPKDEFLNTIPGKIPLKVEVIQQMRSTLSRLWWSRLVIAVRGYVINYVQVEDSALFHCDDAFTAIHRTLAEEECDYERADVFLSDLNVILQVPLISEILLALSSGREVENPFLNPKTKDAFQRIFGFPNVMTYKVAEGQKCAFIVFMRVLCILQERWIAEKAKKKGIRFETDPEWQPDDRVVLFQHFFQGNRTWVLLDFDRYILSQWRPKGASIIFGDSFVAKKQRLGMKLCTYCGMIEQKVDQFPEQDKKPFCSPECLEAVYGQLGPTTIKI